MVATSGSRFGESFRGLLVEKMEIGVVLLWNQFFQGYSNLLFLLGQSRGSGCLGLNVKVWLRGRYGGYGGDQDRLVVVFLGWGVIRIFGQGLVDDFCYGSGLSSEFELQRGAFPFQGSSFPIDDWVFRF